MEKIKLISGIDNGNSEHLSIINGVVIKQPNVISKVKVENIPTFEGMGKESLIETIHNRTIGSILSAKMSGTYYSGNYSTTSRERSISTAIGDNDKVNSDNVFINTLFVHAAEALRIANKKGMIKEDHQHIDVEIEMTTSIPSEQYSRESSKKLADKFLQGSHSVMLHLNEFTPMMKLKFIYVKVLPEGVDVMHALCSSEKMELKLNENEEKKEFNIFKALPYKNQDELNSEESTEAIYYNFSDFVGKKVQHTAIGEDSLDLPCTDGLDFNPEFIRGYQEGIGHAIEDALPGFLEKTNNKNFSRQKFSQILQDKNNKFHNIAFDQIEYHLETRAQSTYEKTIAEIEKNDNMIDINLVYGGGSILFKPYLKNKLKKYMNKIDAKLIYVDEGIATLIEAIGLYAFTTGPIFKELKSSYIEKNKEVKDNDERDNSKI